MPSMDGYVQHEVLPTFIPLHCYVCPKKPDFSDVSHLLTHIASKGHLSHHMKTKLRAGNDPNAEEALAEYNEWYEEWNIEELMRERMNQKERKKGGANGNAVGANGSRRASAG